MATTVPAGVAAALEAGRVGSQYPYAPMKPAEPGWGRDLRRDYVAVPSSLANSPHFSNTIGTPDGQGDAEGLSRRHFIPLKDPAEAMTLSRQLLTLHRAYGTYDVRDQVTPAAAEQVARSILGEWSMSRRANHDSGRRDSAAPWPAAKSPPPVELSPQAKWLAAQREMQDLNDALVQVDAVLPPPCVCPEKQPGYQHSLWDEEKRSEADEVSVRSVSENPEVPVPVDAYGAPVDKEKLYFVAENMIKCGACGAKLLSTARYCHWCQYKVHVKCIDCGDNTRTPATTCIHCQQMLPTISLQDNANMPPHMVPLHRVGRPPVPINNLGHPVDDNKVYFVSYEMEHCGQCNALMLNWSNFCHWCASHVYVKCSGCSELARTPAEFCTQCQQMLPMKVQEGPQPYYPTGANGENQPSGPVDLDWEPHDEKITRPPGHEGPQPLAPDGTPMPAPVRLPPDSAFALPEVQEHEYPVPDGSIDPLDRTVPTPPPEVESEEPVSPKPKPKKKKKKPAAKSAGALEPEEQGSPASQAAAEPHADDNASQKSPRSKAKPKKTKTTDPEKKLDAEEDNVGSGDGTPGSDAKPAKKKTVKPKSKKAAKSSDGEQQANQEDADGKSDADGSKK